MTKLKRGGQPGNTSRKLKDPTKRRMRFGPVMLDPDNGRWLEEWCKDFVNKSRGADELIFYFRLLLEKGEFVETIDIDDLEEISPGVYKRITK